MKILLIIIIVVSSLISCTKKDLFKVHVPIKEVVITIDDAPNFPTNTSKMLDALEGYPATFFCIGEYLNIYPELANRIAKDFTMSNHTWDHNDMKKCSNAQLDFELLKTDSIIRFYNSKYNKQNNYFRYPFGSASNEDLDYTSKLGFTTIWWQLDASDWDNNVSLKQIKDYYTNQLNTYEGTPIIIFHLSDNSIEAMKWLLLELNKRNIKVISLQEYLSK
jgi:peptidoglycan-N-acetylmuramic acid deacetylase